MYDEYLAINKKNAEEIDLDAEFTIIHDPQPAALIERNRALPLGRYLRDLAEWISSQPGMAAFGPLWQSVLSKELKDESESDEELAGVPT